MISNDALKYYICGAKPIRKSEQIKSELHCTNSFDLLDAAKQNVKLYQNEYQTSINDIFRMLHN